MMSMRMQMEMMVWALLCVVGEDASWARHDLMPMACSDGGGVVGLLLLLLLHKKVMVMVLVMRRRMMMEMMVWTLWLVLVRMHDA